MPEKTDLFERTFTASEVAKLTGINIETLRVWRRRKQIVLEGERQGWTRYTFSDLMVVTTYHTLVRAHCTNAMSEMIAGTITIRLERRWQDILDVPEGVYCLCNMSAEDKSLEINLHNGMGQLMAAIEHYVGSGERQPAYHVVDCTALINSICTAYDTLNSLQET